MGVLTTVSGPRLRFRHVAGKTQVLCLAVGLMAALAPPPAGAADGPVRTADIPLRPSYTLRESGQPRALELALDEVALVGAGGRREIRKLVAAADPQRLRATIQGMPAAEAGALELVLYPVGSPRTDFTRRYVTRRVLVSVKDGVDPAVVARTLDARPVRVHPFAPGYAVVETASSADALIAGETFASVPGVVSAEPLLARQRAAKTVPNDPLFPDQWHLRNTGQLGGARWIDANLAPAWDIHRGAGIHIAVVDDGVQHAHPDLAAHYDTSLDQDYNDDDDDAAPAILNEDTHGTQVAGVVGAVGNNGLGVAGAAYEATITGLRLIAAPSADDEEALAMAHANHVIDVKHNSWGAPDDGMTLEGPGPLTQAALSNGVTSGRGGRGVVYVFSGGNGLDVADDSNKDGYANSVYTIAVGAVDDAGVQAYYSEPGANLTVSAPSGDGLAQAGISTTDITGNGGDNTNAVADDYVDRDYTKRFSGTSASAPVVSGVAALMLGVNPELGWRDVQEILIASARRVHWADGDWSTNAAGYGFNHKYGAGLVDAHAAVGLAGVWSNLGPWVSTAISQTGLGLPIPDNNSTGVSRTFAFTTNGFRVERVAVTLNVTHPYRGDLEVLLTSPAGTVSRLVGQHFDNGANYADWTFTSVRHWGEWAVGSWTVRIADRSAGDVGTLNSVTVRLHGSLAPGARMAPAGTTLLAESLLPANAAVDPGETVAISVGIRNTGTTAATNLTASLLALGGVSSPGPDQDYGILAPGTTAWRPFTFTASGACGAGATALFRLQAGSRPLGVLSVPVNLGRSTTTNVDSSGGITIPSQGAGVPSPSTITVGGLTGRLQRISARLSGVTHTYLHDISTALVAPGGLHLLLQDSGTKSAVSGLTWTFDDSASTYIPGNVSASGTYRPFDYYGAVPPAVPEGEIAFTLGEFLGTPPAGTWRLYVDDSGAGDSGSISGWRLSLTTVDCADNVLFGATSHLADETNGVLAVAVLRTSGRDGAATVNYATSNGTATAGSDYVATSGTLAFAAGETSKTVNVTLMNDALWEGSESFSIRLWGAGGVACLGGSTSAIVTVRDGDFDRDGMPDDWETVNGLAWDNANDGALDADGDRLPNIAEYVADRDPNDPSSYLGLTCVHPTGGFARVEWVGGTLARQWLESRTNLASGATWKPILTNEPPTAVTNRFLDRSATNGLPYYRVRVQRD